MHVILNVESLLKPSGGIGRYTWHLLDGLVERGFIDNFSCFANYKWVDGLSLLTNNRERSSNSEKTIDESIRNLIRKIPYSNAALSYVREAVFRLEARKSDNSIYHEPNYILKPFNGYTVLTIHDLSHIHFPQFHPNDRVEFLKRNLPKSLNKASHIITDSEFIRNELIEYYGIDVNRITAIPLGVDGTKYSASKLDLENSTLKKYGLKPGRYILSIATLEPRKNVNGIIDAYMQLSSDLKKQYPLVLGGCQGWKNADTLKKISKLKDSNVIFLGYLSEEDLSILYSGACFFVYMPFYEGFGLPPLEAMASGIPVLTSRVASIPEVVGNAALTVDPHDIEIITNEMEKLLTDAALREKLIADGFVRAKRFSWDHCVERTVEIYKKIMT